MIKLVANFLALITACFWLNTSYAQTAVTSPNDLFSGHEWKLFYSKALESDTLLNFIIESLPEEVNQKGQWGHFIRFSNGEFSTRYAAPCGLDCFTKISGTYQMNKNDEIEFNVSTITRSKVCEKDSETVPKEIGTFRLKKTNNGYEFIKLL